MKNKRIPIGAIKKCTKNKVLVSVDFANTSPLVIFKKHRLWKKSNEESIGCLVTFAGKDKVRIWETK